MLKNTFSLLNMF